MDRRKKAFYILSLSACIIFYLIFALVDGPVICVDSQSYISMDITREPLYPAFLALLRMVPGATADFAGIPAYLYLAVYIQSIVWGFATWLLGKTAGEIYAGIAFRSDKNTESFMGFGKHDFRGALISCAAMLIQASVSLLNRFAASRGSMYSECIMTESLAMPVFIIFSLELYKYYSLVASERCTGRSGNCDHDPSGNCDHGSSGNCNHGLSGNCNHDPSGNCNHGSQRLKTREGKCFAALIILAIIMIDLRKQMMVVVVIWAAMSVLYDLFMKGRSPRRFLKTIIAIAAVMLISSGVDRTYNYIVRGAFIEHAGNYMGQLCTLVYSSDSGDAELFDKYGDEETKALYVEIISESESQGLTIGSAPTDGSWIDLEDHFAESYDVIGYDIINPVVQEYIMDTYGYGEVDEFLCYDRLMSRMCSVLRHQDKGDILRVYGVNFLTAITDSNARVMTLGLQISVAMYALFLALYVVCRVRGNLLMRRGMTDGNFDNGNYCKPDYSAQMSEDAADPDGTFVDIRPNAVFVFAEVSLGGIIINSLVVSAVIFPQARYMIYGMGLFYTALMLLIIGNVRLIRSMQRPQTIGMTQISPNSPE